MPADDQHDQLERLARWARRDRTPDADDPRAALDDLMALVPHADWASLTMRRRRGRFETVAATDAIAVEADRLQYELSEGPCLEAAEESDWFRSGDLAEDPRWPTWGRAVARVGPHSVLSIGLHDAESLVGAINLYGRVPGAFGVRADVDLALVLAAHLAERLSKIEQVAQLRTAVSARHAIGLAQGILVERLSLTPDEAFAVIRRYSMERNVKAQEVAAEIVAGAGRGST